MIKSQMDFNKIIVKFINNDNKGNFKHEQNIIKHKIKSSAEYIINTIDVNNLINDIIQTYIKSDNDNNENKIRMILLYDSEYKQYFINGNMFVNVLEFHNPKIIFANKTLMTDSNKLHYLSNKSIKYQNYDIYIDESYQYFFNDIYRLTKSNKYLLDEYVIFKRLTKIEHINHKFNDVLLNKIFIFDKSNSFETYIDEKVKKKFFDKIIKISEEINLDEIVIVNNKSVYNTNLMVYIDNSFCYKMKSIYLFYVAFSSEAEINIQMFGIVNTINKECIFLGCSGNSPFIMSNDFFYYNSDTLCPRIKIDDCSGKNIFKMMKTYYQEFCNDKYH